MNTTISDTNLVHETNGETKPNINLLNELASKFTDLYMDSLTDEDKELVFNAISNELWDYSCSNKKIFKLKTNSGYYNNDTPLWGLCKDKIQIRFSEAIDKKIDEILESDDIKKKIDNIAKEIIEYAVSGYKNDMINRIRERLVSNVIYGEPYYDNKNIREIIHEELQQYFPRQ